MTLDIQTITAKAPVIKVVLLTEENIHEVGELIGAKSMELQYIKDKIYVRYSRTEDLHTGNTLGRAIVGEYLIIHPEFYGAFGQKMDLYFESVDKEALERFRTQSAENGGVDISAAPYDR